MIVRVVDAELAQRLRLQLGVLDDRSPERPGVRDDDPDLHRGQHKRADRSGVAAAVSTRPPALAGYSPNPSRRSARRLADVFDGGLAELHTHLGGSVASDILWSLAHEQGIALPVKDYWEFDRLVTGHRPARRAEPRRARRDLPLDGADPVEPARGRALGARGDRRRLPLAGDHDARAALQPDEAKPRRRARPRPHHPRRDPRARPRRARVPAGARRADPDDGPHVHARAERRSSSRRRSAGRRAASSASTSPARGRAAGATTTRRSRRWSRRRARPASA